ncbi:MAG: DUF1573 domain-containing protein [Planctomycetaceae bacterium]|nr:DUF1573 domain-containing protein [Planctomycetaceae bacterium]
MAEKKYWSKQKSTKQFTKPVVSQYLPQKQTQETIKKSGFFIEPEQINFGNIVEGELIEGQTRLINHSNNSIEVISIHTSCGCTSSNLSEKVIALGQEIILPFSIRTNGKVGDFTAQFEISYREQNSNEIKKSFFYAKLTGMTPGRLVAEPASLSLKNIVPSAVVTASVLLRLPDGIEKDHIPTVISIEKPEWLQTELAPIKQKTNGNFEGQMNITCTVPRTSGMITDSIKLVSDHDRFPILTIPVSLYVDGVFHIEPKHIVKVLSVEEFPFTTEVSIRLDKEGMVQCSQFSYSDFKYSYESLEQNRKYRLSFDRKTKECNDREIIKGNITFSAMILEEIHTVSLPVLIVVKPKEEMK